MTRKHFEAKAAEFKRVLGLVPDAERQRAVLADIDIYMDLAAEVNPRFDRDRFLAACGLGDRRV